jgi:NTE family protein
MNIGLVLSGGGIKGVAHIGAIKALEEHGLYPTHISGSSAGAVVGAFYSANYTPEEMLAFFKVTPLFNLSRFSFRKPGFIDTDNFYNDFKKYFPDDNFNTLEKKLYITTVDMLNGKIKVFEKGELIRAFLASAAFPGIFSPVAIGDGMFADGGILDNFPIAPLSGGFDIIIGVYTSPIQIITADKLRNSLSVLDRAIKINFSSGSLSKFSACDILIYPDALNKFSLFDRNHINEIYQIGYLATQKKLLELKKAKII